MRVGKSSRRAVTAVVTLLSTFSTPSAATTILYVANYLESITTLELTTTTKTMTGGSSATDQLLKVVAKTPGCGQASSWLTHDPNTNRLFCMDESLPNGTISSFATETDGSLSRLAIVDTIRGTVASTLFGQGNGLAVAY